MLHFIFINSRYVNTSNKTAHTVTQTRFNKKQSYKFKHTKKKQYIY